MKSPPIRACLRNSSSSTSLGGAGCRATGRGSPLCPSPELELERGFSFQRPRAPARAVGAGCRRRLPLAAPPLRFGRPLVGGVLSLAYSF
uniref:Uncharacterized protein n=1 Tax=Arundo donax TaxID=35708 RepID=A0A0A8Y977_ARUDO